MDMERRGNVYEEGKKFIVKNVRKFSRFHPRCGTSFIVIVILLSIIIYTFIPKEYSFWLKLGLRLALLPLIAGVSYELLKFFAKHIDNWLVRILIKPGLWVQRLTTREPTDDQLEISLVALKTAVCREEGRLSEQVFIKFASDNIGTF